MNVIIALFNNIPQGSMMAFTKFIIHRLMNFMCIETITIKKNKCVTIASEDSPQAIDC